METKPKVSVLMSVYNGEKYLREAIESILNQTYKDFEFIIINDGSTDKSMKIINSFNDNRINLINNPQNLGLIASLNKGLKLSKGEYIARMDADDISFSQRLEKQVEYMDKNPDIGICGAQAVFTGIPIKYELKRLPCNPDLVKVSLLFENPLAHPTVIIRKNIIESFNLCYPDEKYVEDYALWILASKYTKLANLEENLLHYRKHNEQIGINKRKEQIEQDFKVKSHLYKEIGLNFSEPEYNTLKSFCSNNIPVDIDFIKSFEKILFKIKDFNDINNVFDKNKLSLVLFQKWYNLCLKAGRNGLWTWNIFWNSSLSKERDFNVKDKIKFFLNLIAGKLRIYSLYKKIIKFYLKQNS